jgi:hypothetical protein
MQAAETILAVLVAVAVIGQLCLPLWGRLHARSQRRQLVQRRARLLEAAADQQDVTYSTNAAKVDSTTQQGQKHV